jgi:hypothetical protein
VVTKQTLLRVIQGCCCVHLMVDRSLISQGSSNTQPNRPSCSTSRSGFQHGVSHCLVPAAEYTVLGLPTGSYYALVGNGGSSGALIRAFTINSCIDKNSQESTVFWDRSFWNTTTLSSTLPTPTLVHYFCLRSDKCIWS